MKPFKHSTEVPSDKWDYLQHFCQSKSVHKCCSKKSLNDQLIPQIKILMHLMIVLEWSRISFSRFIQDSLHKTDNGVITLDFEPEWMRTMPRGEMCWDIQYISEDRDNRGKYWGWRGCGTHPLRPWDYPRPSRFPSVSKSILPWWWLGMLYNV